MARGRSRVETLPVHSTLLALTLAAYFLVRLWDLPSGHTAASPSLDKGGPGLDPSGVTATAVSATDAGPGLDPFGAKAAAPTTEEGPGLDPFGRS